METIKDLWASMVAYVNERSTNPLTSAFILTWAGWNYKFFVLLFSDLTPIEKFEQINELYPRPETYYGSGLLYPALTALFYVFVYPFITSWVVAFYRTRQVEIANKIKKVEGQRVRTVEEVSRLVREYEKKLATADADLKTARDESGQLRIALAAAEGEALTPSEARDRMIGKLHKIPTATADNIVNMIRTASEAHPDDRHEPVENTSTPITVKPVELFSFDEMRVIAYLFATYGDSRSISEIENRLLLGSDEVSHIVTKLHLLSVVRMVGDEVHITDQGKALFLELEKRGEVPPDVLISR